MTSCFSYTKASLVASIIFILDKKTEVISAPHALVYFGIVIFLVYFKLSSILLGIHDPFVPFENLLCALFFGGIWDSLAKIFGRNQIKENESKDIKKTNWGLPKGKCDLVRRVIFSECSNLLLYFKYLLHFLWIVPKILICCCSCWFKVTFT